MRTPSLRTWLLIISIVFAVLVVGGIALTSYVIIFNGMQAVALETAQQVATTAASLLREESAEVETDTVVATQPQGQRAALELTLLLSHLPGAISRAGLGEARFSLYDQNLEPVWASSASAVATDESAARKQALSKGAATRSVLPGAPLLTGLFTRSLMSRTVIHTPVALPGGATGVLDVTYVPTVEQRVIDEIRVPMAALAFSAMFIMVLLMQTSLTWVLGLIDDLRRATDAIEAGRFDERLPDAGDNEVGALARSINKLVDRLQRRADAQSRFVADASHELATPVAGIRGYTSILRAWGAEDARVREEAVDAIDRESRRMARLTGDLLNLLHADQGLVLKSERFDLNTLVRSRIAVTASRWIEKNIEYVGPSEDTPLPMAGDPERVEDVISILLDNASKYTPSEGTISARTRRKREIMIVEVTDSGVGIAPDDLPRVFDRFYRSEASRAAGEGGFGLGLAIAQSIVHGMGGEILADSVVGEGTTFTVILPRGRV